MFYANFVLAKKGPLARVWLAAHWEKKLSKAHVFETDLESSVETIISPKVKIALRTSGHLLLGVVRIYSRKAKYLLADCTEALLKIKMAFRPDVVDLPLDNQKAAVSAITLPEFQEWDVMMNNMGNFDITATLNNNQCRVEEITMKEDLISARFLSDDNFFGDTQFGETSEEIMRDEVTLGMAADIQADLTKTLIPEDDTKEESSLSINQSNLELAMGGDGFGAGEGLDFLEGFGMEEEGEIPGLEDIDKFDATLTKPNQEIDETLKDDGVETVTEDLHEADAEVPELPTEMTTGVETTLFSRDTEAFALEPVEVTVGKEKRRKRKRKLVVDEEKIIPNEKMKEQMNSHDDIVKAAVVAPPSRARMTLCDSSAKTLFLQPTALQSKRRHLNKRYEEQLTTTIIDDFQLPSSQEDEVELEAPSEILRDAGKMTELPEVTNDVTDVEKTQLEDEILEEFIPPLPVDDVDIDMRVNEDLNDEDLQVPPPFEFEKDVSEFMKEVEEGGEDKEDELDKRWTKRTQQTLNMLGKGLKKKDTINFKELIKKCSRKQAAYKFYTLLLLRKEKAIEVSQDELFGAIMISRGERFVSHS